MSFLELFHRHMKGLKDHVVHVVEVPVPGEDPILLCVLLIDPRSRVGGEDGQDGGVDLSLFAEIHYLAKNRRVVGV